MIYVFDSGPLIHLFTFFYRERFPTLWDKFDDLISDENIISVKEVRNELEDYDSKLAKWVKKNSEIFIPPEHDELMFVRRIFENQHYQMLINRKARLKGMPVADPFVIAKAHACGGCVVTSEKFKDNSAKIPNICKNFDIPYCNLEEFMERENWMF